MKNAVALITLFLLASINAFPQVGINTSNSSPDPSAMLDVNSINKGMLIPRMTASQRDVISSPATGLLVFCTDNNQYYSNKGTPATPNWLMVSSQWITSGSAISYPLGNVGIGVSVPAVHLDVRGSNTDDGAVFQLGNSDLSHRMVLFGGRQNDPNPFISWKQGDPLRFATDEGGWSEKMRITGDGKVGIGTALPNAALEINSTTQGFLPPRMNTIQRNNIGSPAEGLVIYNTDEKVLNLYNGMTWNSMIPVPAFVCGLTISINHLVSGGVAPVNKTVAYGTVTNIPGEPLKCWITSNLGADHQAAAVNDATEASAGWYWQFNHKQGFKHDGTTRTPNTRWISGLIENSDWIAANDPCAIELGIGWRIPTSTELTNVTAAGNWMEWNGPWNSALKMHAAGFMVDTDGSLTGRGSSGVYWSSTQGDTADGWYLFFGGLTCLISSYTKASPYSVRCVREY